MCARRIEVNLRPDSYRDQVISFKAVCRKVCGSDKYNQGSKIDSTFS